MSLDHLPAMAQRTYRDRLAVLSRQYQQIPARTPVRLAKPTSNLFRMRSAAAGPGLDVAAFDGVLHVDPDRRTADVLGMTTYEHLVAATLPYGLMPTVVPQLKTITLGGAVTGLGIESSSFRAGLPHEAVIEMDILTGAGEVVTARRDNEHADLFYGFPNSYGTLGYALRLQIELAPTRPFVELTHVRFSHAADIATAMADITDSGEYQGRAVDFLDGTVFDENEHYLTLGRWVDEAPYTSDYTGRNIYYRSVQQRNTDYLTVADYIWRWDTDWFWCSGGLGVQKPWVRPFIPKRYLRSDVYFKVVGFARRTGFVNRLARLKGQANPEYVVQDIEVPADRLPEFLEFFHDRVGIKPVWLCPLRQQNPGERWDLYVMDPATTYVNVGFWSSVPIAPGRSDGDVNREIELAVQRLDGRKSLYSTSFYPEQEFWSIYNGTKYTDLKNEYDPDQRLLDLYAKCVKGG